MRPAGWGEAFRGKERLATILGEFGVVSRQWRAEKGTRGYLRADLEPVWMRYLAGDADTPSFAEEGNPVRDSVTEERPEEFQGETVGVTPPGRHADEDAGNANGEKGRHAVTPIGGRGCCPLRKLWRDPSSGDPGCFRCWRSSGHLDHLRLGRIPRRGGAMGVRNDVQNTLGHGGPSFQD
jgi:hypothetical protein